MTGSTSCYRRRTFGLPLQPGVRSTRKSQHKYSAKSGKGCRPFICGWMSSYGGGCYLTECTSQHLLGNPKQNSMPCSLTKLLDATEKTLMKRRSTVEPESKRSEHGGRAVEIGWKAIRTYGDPFVFDFKELLKALSAKDKAAQLEVDIFMENCAKRWQTKDGTYRLKRRRLPDVRDSPGYPGADIDMEDI